jgi:hypothetical protein
MWFKLNWNMCLCCFGGQTHSIFKCDNWKAMSWKGFLPNTSWNQLQEFLSKYHNHIWNLNLLPPNELQSTTMYQCHWNNICYLLSPSPPINMKIKKLGNISLVLRWYKIKNLPSFKQIIMTNQSKEQSFFSNGSFEGHCIMYIFIQPKFRPIHATWRLHFIGLAYQGKDIVFRFIIEYSSLRDFGP